jgi:DNA-binding IclR family transcriptional regulator
MAVFSDPDVLYLVHVSTNRMVRLAAGVGTRFPAHATSLGRILTAHLPDEQVARYVKTTPLNRFTDKTIVDRRRLRADPEAGSPQRLREYHRRARLRHRVRGRTRARRRW